VRNHGCSRQWRWTRLFPSRHAHDPEARIAALALNTERIVLLRQRLADLGWFMRLNEPARRSVP
jgi:hypothetical protein